MIAHGDNDLVAVLLVGENCHASAPWRVLYCVSHEIAYRTTQQNWISRQLKRPLHLDIQRNAHFLCYAAKVIGYTLQFQIHGHDLPAN